MSRLGRIEASFILFSLLHQFWSFPSPPGSSPPPVFPPLLPFVGFVGFVFDPPFSVVPLFCDPLPPPLPLVFVVALAFFSDASRFRLLAISSPVARARSFTPLMFFDTVKTSSLTAPPLFLMPSEKMARSAIFTFLPSSSSSLMHYTMSVSIPVMTPFEYGVL